MIAAIIPGSGSGQRMSYKTPKIFIRLKGKPIVCHAIDTIASVADIEHVLLTVPQGWKSKAEDLLAEHGAAGVNVIEGGATRQETVHMALQLLPKNVKLVVVHDGARPFASADLFRSVISGATKHGACIPSLPCDETVKVVHGGLVAQTLKRSDVHLIQTPQAFYFDTIMEAHQHAFERNQRVTDDAELIERLGRPVSVVPGERANIKITTPADLVIARALLSSVL